MITLKTIERLLAELGQKGELRLPEDGDIRSRVKEAALRGGVPFVDASSNDYLGLALGCVWNGGGDGDEGCGAASGRARSNVSRETTGGREMGGTAMPSETARVGAGASRLLGGTQPEHAALEEALAQWVHQPEALLFSSGYAANLGLLSSLPQPEDLVLSDSLNHASIIDGCRLSKAKVGVYVHRDLDMLEAMLRDSPCQGQKWVVSETYFSMDGDCPNLPRLRDLCDRHEAGLILDEAHALGVYGTSGAGLAEERGIAPDVFVGAFGKAVGLQGAFVAGPRGLKRWLWNKARSFVFSTAPTPGLAAQLLLHVKHVQGAEAGRRRLQALVSRVRQALASEGMPVAASSFGPIIPLMVGDSRLAVEVAEHLRTEGILAFPVRPPTVPEGTARLRLTITAATTEEGIDHLVKALTRAFQAAATRTPSIRGL